MLKTRILTASILLPLVLAAFIFGPQWLIFIFLLFSLSLSVFEAATMLWPAFDRYFAPGRGAAAAPEQISAPKISSDTLIPALLMVALGWLLFFGGVKGGATPVASVLLVSLLGSTLVALTSTIEQGMGRAIVVILSLVLGALPWLVVWDLYLMGEQSRFLMLVMAVIWSGDTGGYFGGRYFGGKIFGSKKMAPRISPKKTWEGAVAGILLSVLGALLVNLFYGMTLGSFGLMVAIGVFGGFFGQLGDLVESSFKRFAGVKDSSALLPGHGGFLDRVDGILFAVPVIWFIIYYFG